MHKISKTQIVKCVIFCCCHYYCWKFDFCDGFLLLFQQFPTFIWFDLIWSTILFYVRYRKMHNLRISGKYSKRIAKVCSHSEIKHTSVKSNERVYAYHVTNWRERERKETTAQNKSVRMHLQMYALSNVSIIIKH